MALGVEFHRELDVHLECERFSGSGGILRKSGDRRARGGQSAQIRHYELTSGTIGLKNGEQLHIRNEGSLNLRPRQEDFSHETRSFADAG